MLLPNVISPTKIALINILLGYPTIIFLFQAIGNLLHKTITMTTYWINEDHNTWLNVPDKCNPVNCGIIRVVLESLASLQRTLWRYTSPMRRFLFVDSCHFLNHLGFPIESAGCQPEMARFPKPLPDSK